MQYVTLDHILAMAMAETGKPGGTAPQHFVEWAYQAERAIGPSWNNVRNEVLRIENGVAEKPCGYVDGIDLCLLFLPPGTEDGCHLDNMPEGCFRGWPIYRGKAFGRMAPGIAASDSVALPFRLFPRSVNQFVTFSDDDCNFYFSHTSQHGGGTDTLANACLVSFLGVPIDGEGHIKIPESHERAVIAYIAYKDMQVLNRHYPTQYGMGSVQFYQSEWRSLKATARAIDNLPDNIEMREIAARAVSRIFEISRSRRTEYRTL